MSRRAATLVVVSGLAFFTGVLSRPALTRLRDRFSSKSMAGGPNDPARHERKTRHYIGIQTARKIVFLGDSRIEEAEWSELFGRSDISNRGISGDTTAGVLSRVSSAVPEEGGVCVIQLGVNDLGKGVPVETVVGNYRRILDYLRTEKKRRVIVTSVLPVAEQLTELNQVIAECNMSLALVAAATGAEWLDLNAAFCPEGVLPPEFSPDGLHLNSEGYRRMRDALKPLLDGQPAPPAL